MTDKPSETVNSTASGFDYGALSKASDEYRAQIAREHKISEAELVKRIAEYSRAKGDALLHQGTANKYDEVVTWGARQQSYGNYLAGDRERKNQIADARHARNDKILKDFRRGVEGHTQLWAMREKAAVSRALRAQANRKYSWDEVKNDYRLDGQKELVGDFYIGMGKAMWNVVVVENLELVSNIGMMANPAGQAHLLSGGGWSDFSAMKFKNVDPQMEQMVRYSEMALGAKGLLSLGKMGLKAGGKYLAANSDEIMGLGKRFVNDTSGAVPIPFTRSAKSIEQQRQITELAQTARNEFAADFSKLDSALSPAQKRRIVNTGGKPKPFLTQMFAGTEIEVKVAAQIKSIVKANPDSPLAGIKWTGKTNAPYDFKGVGGVKFELTTNNPTTIARHQVRPKVDFVLSYDSLPSDFGYRYLQHLKRKLKG